MQVRDMLTTDHEQQLKARGQPGPASSLRRDAVRVDACRQHHRLPPGKLPPPRASLAALAYWRQ